jgi:hypothetical protein
MLQVVHGELGMQLTSAIQEGIRTWAAEVGVLLDACRQLVEYYGTDAEADSFHSGAEAPLWFVEALNTIASGKEVDTSKGPPFSKFVCSEPLAEMLTPLLRIVVEWQPDFVADARQTLDEQQGKRLIVPYGQFIGTVGTYLCDPLWSTYLRLAPAGWSA